MSKKDLYRPNVAMIVVSNNYPAKKEIFLAQRNDLGDVWQFPQGGIDKGEEVKEADFPSKIAKNMKPYIGQKQKYFLVKLNENAKINIKTEHPEFSDYKFVGIEDVLALSANFKKDVYTSVINYFNNEGLL